MVLGTKDNKIFFTLAVDIESLSKSALVTIEARLKSREFVYF